MARRGMSVLEVGTAAAAAVLPAPLPGLVLDLLHPRTATLIFLACT